MRVVFGTNFDAGAWPGALGDVDARLDEAWVGPLGFLKILETHLGLGGVHSDVTRAERAASLVPALRATSGAWSKSLDADPLAVARTVLRLRDALVDAGVAPATPSDALPPRLRAVVDVCRGVLQGPGDRLWSVVAELDRRAAAVSDIVLTEPERALSPVWRRVITGLRSRGARVAEGADVVGADAGPGAASCDLVASRRAPFLPRNDGTLQLLRADCPEEAAGEVAAHIASLQEPVLVIGGDALLDVGLARLGLPTLGARGERGDDGLLQLAPLIVALAWPERDPDRAFELLTLPVSPLPKRIAGPLSRALTREPAVDSDEWRKVLDEKLKDLPVVEADRVRMRLHQLFGTEAPSSSSSSSSSSASPAAPTGADVMPLALLEQRLTIVNGWLQRRMQTEADGDKVLGAIAQVASIRRIARAFGAAALTRTELMRVVEQATAGVRPMRARRPLAGLAQVRDPGAVAGPCAHIVWWSFTSAHEHPVRTPSISREERLALVAAGVEMPEPGKAAEQRAALFQRPLFAATSSLVLCCPRRDRVGDAAHPHPLWDEIVARAGNDDAVRALEVGTLAQREGALPRKLFRDRAVALPHSTWRFTAGAVKRPDVESATQAETLLGCTFRAVLERSGLRSRRRRLPDGTQLFGDLAHDVLARVLLERPATASAAAERARAIFDERVPKRAAILLRPVEATQRTRARDLVVRAAERLVEILEERKLAVKNVELSIERGVEGRKMTGRLDLVVGDPLVVIDHKSGSERRRLRELEQGTAIQLAVYAALLKEASAPWPGIGYFQIRSRRLLTTDPVLGGEQAIDPGSHDVAWTASRIKKNASVAESEIAAGRCDAPGVGRKLSQLRSQPIEEELYVAPPCRYCNFALLCGRALPGGSE